jgi:hypothetical protein
VAGAVADEVFVTVVANNAYAVRLDSASSDEARSSITAAAGR